MPTLPQILLLAAMGTLIFSLWRRAHRQFARVQEQPVKPAAFSTTQPPRDLALADAPPELTRWQIEMYETARDLKAEIDTKLALLQVLTTQALAAAERLEGAIARIPTGLADGSTDSLTVIESWGNPRVRTAVRETRHDPVCHPQAGRIYALADAGHDAQRIAHETGLPLGEVEMTLSLRV